MRRRKAFCLGAACILVAGFGAAAAASAATAGVAAASAASLGRGTAEQLPSMAALVTGDGLASFTSLSCASAGNCAAGGGYVSGKNYEANVISEASGTWGKARPVPGLAAMNVGGNAATMAVSCYAAGYCTAGGYYTDRKAARSPWPRAKAPAR